MNTKNHKENIDKIYGIAAVRSFLKFRRDEILKFVLIRERMKEFSEELKQFSAQKKFYEIVDEETLERRTRTTHHQGVCVYIKSKPPLSLKEALAKQLDKKTDLIIISDGVSNPHNLGAIIRTAAFFGIDILVCDPTTATLSSSVHRVSEGGTNFVTICHEANLKNAISFLKNAGYGVVATEVSNTKQKITPLNSFSWPQKTALILGAEVTGVSPDIQKMAEKLLTIPTLNEAPQAIESLNVSAAFAVLCYDFFVKNQ